MVGVDGVFSGEMKFPTLDHKFVAVFTIPLVTSPALSATAEPIFIAESVTELVTLTALSAKVPTESTAFWSISHQNCPGTTDTTDHAALFPISTVLETVVFPRSTAPDIACPQALTVLAPISFIIPTAFSIKLPP